MHSLPMMVQVIPPFKYSATSKTRNRIPLEMLCIDMAVPISLAVEGLAAIAIAILPFASEYTDRMRVLEPVKC